MKNSILLFKLNNMLCGVCANEVERIVKYQSGIKPEDLPGFFDGIVEERGISIPFIDLNKRFFGISTEPAKKTKIIICKENNGYKGNIGYMVDDVLHLHQASEYDMEKPAENIIGHSSRYVKSILKKDGFAIPVYSLSSILSDEEALQLTGSIA